MLAFFYFSHYQCKTANVENEIVNMFLARQHVCNIVMYGVLFNFNYLEHDPF
jgi:hypothetical protein